MVLGISFRLHPVLLPLTGSLNSQLLFLVLGANENGHLAKAIKITYTVNMSTLDTTSLFAYDFGYTLLDKTATKTLQSGSQITQTDRIVNPQDTDGLWVTPTRPRATALNFPLYNRGLIPFTPDFEMLPAMLNVELKWKTKLGETSGSNFMIFDLVPYSGHEWRFPLQVGKLGFHGLGEYYQEAPNHAAGSQGFGHDIGCTGYDLKAC
jgi:hypothetical protein